MLHSRSFSFRLFALLCLLLWAVLASSPAAAQTVWDTLPSMDVVRNRLRLTPEQEAKLAPIFEQRIGELQALREKMGNATSQQKRSLLRDAKKGQNSFNSQVESVLDASQKSDWREMRAELREKARERYEQKQDSQ